MSTTTTPLMDTIRKATEGRDAATLAGLYADDASLTIVDRSTPPSSPRKLHGRSEITAFLDDTCGRAMTHEVRETVQGEGRIAFVEHCRYPDGTRVVCATLAELDDKERITSQTIVQAWDE